MIDQSLPDRGLDPPDNGGEGFMLEVPASFKNEDVS